MDIQLLIVYALPATQNGTSSFNSDLLAAAIQASSLLPLPCIILGDFNGDPFKWNSGNSLKQQGFWDLRALHQRLHGAPMPPTCRGVTTPDNALLCPRASSWVTEVQVLTDEHFDWHKVVTFTLQLQADDAFVQSFRMPDTFLKLPMKDNDLHDAYHMLTQKNGVPPDLEAWGKQVEQSADLAYRWFQVKDQGCPLPATLGMPKKFRGRCQPTQLVNHPVKSHFKKGRPGDYQPAIEVHTNNTQAKVKQIRRLHALLFP